MPVKGEELRNYRQHLLERLDRVAADLQNAAEDLPEKAWHRELPGGGLTPHQTLACLGEKQLEMFTLCIQALLDADQGKTPLVDCSHWLQADYQPGLDWRTAVERFNRGWQPVLAHAARLEAGDWSRDGRHPWFGRRTLQWWLERNLAEVEQTIRVLQSAH